MFATPMILSIVHLNCRSVSFSPICLGSTIRVNQWDVCSFQRTWERGVGGGVGHSWVSSVFIFPASHLYVLVLSLFAEEDDDDSKSTDGYWSPVGSVNDACSMPLRSTSNCIFLKAVDWKQVDLEMNHDPKYNGGGGEGGMTKLAVLRFVWIISTLLVHILHKRCEFFRL